VNTNCLTRFLTFKRTAGLRHALHAIEPEICLLNTKYEGLEGRYDMNYVSHCIAHCMYYARLQGNPVFFFPVGMSSFLFISSSV